MAVDFQNIFCHSSKAHSLGSAVSIASDQSRRKVFLIDDHAMFREGLKQLIDHEPDLMVCGDVAEAEKALKGIVELRPDLAITDLSLAGHTGLELLKTLKAKHRNLPVLVVSMHEESIYAERVLRAGASGYVMKHEPAKTLKLAIRKVIGGDVHLSEKMMASLLNKSMRGVQQEQSSSFMENFSNRELQVFQMLGQGKITRHIAKELGLRHVTVNTFRQRMIKKLHLKHSYELVLLANKWTHEGN
jgi:DNA-binding NarL/FixJ family response regulator